MVLTLRICGNFYQMRGKMSINKRLKSISLILGLLLILSAVGFYWYSTRVRLRCEAVQLERGYGYIVAYGKDTLIYQPYIPAISKKIAFNKKEDALKVANLVCKKLAQRISPSMSRREIDSLGIAIPDF